MEKVSPNVKPLNKEDFSSICRLCLMQGPLASIFELKYEESSFSEILFELFSTKVNSDDELPKNVCETCISQIICFYNFRKVFIASEKTLQAIIGKELNSTIDGPILCDEEIKLEDFINTISNNDLNEEIIIEVKKELDIDTTFELNDQEDQIINVHDSNEKNEIPIDYITTTDNTYTTNDFLDNREDSGKLQKDISSTVNVDCQVLHLANGVEKKREPLQPNIFTCSCQETFTTRSEYIKHRKEVKHPRRRNYTCNICSKSFEKSSWQRHMRTHTKEKPYECKICLDSFSVASSLKRHMMIHTGAKPYVCEICGKGFTRGAYLASHMTTHTGEKPFLCTYCGKTYSDSNWYGVHLKKHGDNETHLLIHGEKKSLCSYCGKTFPTSYLRTHLKVHTGEKPYYCPYCKKAFRSNSNLGVHIRTHTGETPHMCDLCHRWFRHSNSLKTHRKRHLEELKNEKKRD